MALLSATSFAELSSRYPVSAGEARYIYEGFGRQNLAIATGWGVILTGVVSAATLSVATIGFLRDGVDIPIYVGIPVLVFLMAVVAAWGIGESVGIVVLITVIEVGALIYIVVVAGDSLADLPDRWTQFVPTATPDVWVGIFSASFLAFYAFIGFEDMVNMAEEVRDVRTALPKAIFAAVVASTILYVVVALIAVLTVPPAQLSNSNTPVAEIVRDQGAYASTSLWLVSMLTGINGTLVQIIMASRVAYGMAERGQAPSWLGRIHPRTQTPARATGVFAIVILLLALFFPLTTLARATSSIILVIFALVNLALWKVKGRNPDWEGEGPRLPRWLPLLGFSACVAVLMVNVWLQFG